MPQRSAQAGPPRLCASENPRTAQSLVDTACWRGSVDVTAPGVPEWCISLRLLSCSFRTQRCCMCWLLPHRPLPTHQPASLLWHSAIRTLAKSVAVSNCLCVHVWVQARRGSRKGTGRLEWGWGGLLYSKPQQTVRRKGGVQGSHNRKSSSSNDGNNNRRASICLGGWRQQGTSAGVSGRGVRPPLPQKCHSRQLGAARCRQRSCSCSSS